MTAECSAAPKVDHEVDAIPLLARSREHETTKCNDAVSSRSRFFKTAEWSADGTSVITNSANNEIRTYIIPPTLLEQREEPLVLEPYSTIKCAEPVDSVISYPSFDLQNPQTCLFISAMNEHPIRLNSALTGQYLASYPLVSPTTEAFIKPKALLFEPDGSGFIAGSDSLISIFDLSRSGEGPVSSFRTGPRRNSAVWSNPATALRGHISALDVDCQHNVLAAGTFSRTVGLYDNTGHGECLGSFSIQDTEADKAIGGFGITQVIWSPCGRYLYIAERKSDGVVFYDIRKSGQLLGWLEQRNAQTNQRMHVEVQKHVSDSLCDVWAGGIDGNVRRWARPHLSEGACLPETSYEVHPDVVNSTTLHHAGGVLATASGQRNFKIESHTPELKLWLVDAPSSD